MNKLVMLGLLSLLASAAWQAQAQAVWRCGSDGRSFSDRPCADGQPLQVVEAADPRSAAEVIAAHEVAARQRRLADSLRQERLDRERLVLPPRIALAAAQAPRRDAGVSPDRAANKARPSAKRQAPADDGIWRAVAPSSRRTKD
jgi:hypothetical protein